MKTIEECITPMYIVIVRNGDAGCVVNEVFTDKSSACDTAERRGGEVYKVARIEQVR